MRNKELLKTLPALAALFALNTSVVNAFGSHPGGNPGGGGGGSNHGLGTTFLTPYFCLAGSTAATDATASFSTIGNGKHGTTILTLTVPKNSDTVAAYGNVSNNATQTFSSLAFDASSLNNDTGLEVFVLQSNGLSDGAFGTFSDFATTATSSTPAGYTHCVATSSNLPDFFDGPFDPNNTFFSAALIQFESNNNKRSTSVANVNLNNSSTIASAVMQQAQNNCVLIED